MQTVLLQVRLLLSFLSESILFDKVGLLALKHTVNNKSSKALNSRGTKVGKMENLAPERYTAEFCMVAKVIL